MQIIISLFIKEIEMCLLIADNKLVITVASQYDIDFMKEQSIKADIDINKIIIPIPYFTFI